MAVLTLPRIAGETEDAYAKRVVEDSLTTRDGAADFGTEFHHGAERIAQTLEVVEGMILQFIADKYGSVTLLHLPPHVAKEILKRPADFIQAAKNHCEPELKF